MARQPFGAFVHVNKDTRRSHKHTSYLALKPKILPHLPTKLRLEGKGAQKEGTGENGINSSVCGKKTWDRYQGLATKREVQPWPVYF